MYTATLTHRHTKWQYPTTGHVHPECLYVWINLFLFLSALLSLFIALRFSSRHSVFYYGIAFALFNCKQDLMSFYVCSCVVVLRSRVLWTWGKAGQSPILLIILHYNGRHPQTWMTFTAIPMIVKRAQQLCLCVCWNSYDLLSVSSHRWLCPCGHTVYTTVQ